MNWESIAEGLRALVSVERREVRNGTVWLPKLEPFHHTINTAAPWEGAHTWKLEFPTNLPELLAKYETQEGALPGPDSQSWVRLHLGDLDLPEDWMYVRAFHFGWDSAMISSDEYLYFLDVGDSLLYLVQEGDGSPTGVLAAVEPKSSGVAVSQMLELIFRENLLQWHCRPTSMRAFFPELMDVPTLCRLLPHLEFDTWEGDWERESFELGEETELEEEGWDEAGAPVSHEWIN